MDANALALLLALAVLQGTEAPAPTGVPTTVYVNDGDTAVTPGLSATTSPAAGTIYCDATLGGANSALYSVTPNAAGSAVAAATGCTLVRGSNADHSTAATETITVIVCDAADAQCAAAVTITVTVLLPPTISASGLTITNGLTAVNEAVDPSGPAGILVYCAIAGTDGGSFTITPTTAGAAAAIGTGCSMSANTAVDKNTKATYSVDITVYNSLGGNPSTTITETVTVGSENYFPQATYAPGSCLSATAAATTAVMTVASTSHDGSAFTSYTLAGTGSTEFAISTAGAVTVATTPTATSYTLTVTTDPVSRNTPTLTITVCAATTTTTTVATTTAPSSATVTEATSVFVVAAVLSLVVLNI